MKTALSSALVGLMLIAPMPLAAVGGSKTNQIKYYAGRLSQGFLDLSVPAGSPNRLFRHNKGFRQSVLDVLQDSKTQSRGIIDRRGVDTLIRLQDSGRNYFALIWALLTAEKFFRKVIDD